MKASCARDEHAVRGTYLFEKYIGVGSPLPRVHPGEISCDVLTVAASSSHPTILGEIRIGGFRADGPAATQRTR